MKHIRLTVILLLFLEFPFLLSSQLTESLLYDDNRISIDFDISECRDNKNDIHKEYAFLTFNNKTSEAISVTFKQHLWYNDECLTCDVQSEEYTYTIDLAPGQKLVPGCRDRKNRAVAVFSKMINIDTRQLTNIELVDVVVSE